MNDLPKIKAYDGAEPYIFVSYAHRDRETVYLFIAELQKYYNVWFDEGIHYGKEWENEIADRVNNCQTFIFMVTESSLGSDNCKDELHLARNKKKEFINVVMKEGTAFPDWFELRYSRYQSCKLYSFDSYAEAVSSLSEKCLGCKHISDPDRETILNCFSSRGINVTIEAVFEDKDLKTFELRCDGDALLDDLFSAEKRIAAALGCSKVRLYPRFGDENAFVLEIPNDRKPNLFTLLKTDIFLDPTSPLNTVIGTDYKGAPFCFDLKRACHTAIFGENEREVLNAINSMIISLIFKNSAKDLRLALLCYEKAYAPATHLIAPVAEDAKHALAAVKWLVTEAERRTKLFASSQAKDVEEYRQKTDAPMPYIVTVIPNVYDVYKQYPNEFEQVMTELLIKSRHVGIITVIGAYPFRAKSVSGIVLSHFRSKIAFMLKDELTSVVAIGMSGAEDLSGNGDMFVQSHLFMSAIRARSANIPEKEKNEFFLKNAAAPEDRYIDEAVGFIETHLEERLGYVDEEFMASDENELLKKALVLAHEKGFISASALQRTFRRGYATAAKIIDRMERSGFVGRVSENVGKLRFLLSEEEYAEVIKKFDHSS